uniref:Uncharacterized protein n=1 Tax=Clastoptera arizonana TaxID=38151 RepID=A0A1B6CKJ1_9HEMI
MAVNGHQEEIIETNKLCVKDLVKYVEVECVGPAALQFYFQRVLGIEDNKNTQSEIDESDISDDVINDVEIESDINYLRSLDPKLWKDQDHYAVLGLKNIRHRAGEALIRKAHRSQVLKHHPDKRQISDNDKPISKDEDDYFTCITKAYEILSDKTKRRSYDSIDPEFNNEIPSNDQYSKTNFFKVFGEVFERNARWSEKKPVPSLGGPNDNIEKVDRFYSFWYNFESWREYSYLDEEDKDKGEDREGRRYIEKQNKAARAKLKKEEMTRIRNLVDLAYSIDPRIAKFLVEEKEKKLAAKRAKQEAARAAREEEERIAVEEMEKARILKEQAEAAERAKQDAVKIEKEALKKALKKARKNIWTFCKSNNFYVQNQDQTVYHMTSLEKVSEVFDLQQLEDFFKELQINGEKSFLNTIQNVEKKLEEERIKVVEAASNKQIGPNNKKGEATWTNDHLQLLIKAVNLFPAGTNERWEVVANFMNQHSNGIVRTAKEVLNKAKDLQSKDYSKDILKKAANKNAYDNFKKDKKDPLTENVEAYTSERFESVAEQQGVPVPWTNQEQQLLEQALKTYPASTPERWDRIAECLPSRSKKECMKRYKELVEMVKAKKAAQASVSKKD